MTVLRMSAALGCLALSAADVGAQSLDVARSAYEAGRFLEAADLGEALATSDGYALAARALAVHAHFEAADDERDAILDRAVRMGDEAVRADSTNAEAHQQAAHALGRYSQNIGSLTALRQGVATRIRERLDAVIALDPRHAEARMALACWHADIDAAGFVARRMYGGNKAAALVLFEQALGLKPDSREILYEYAIRLAHLDEERGEERARELLERAAELPVLNAYDGFVRDLVLEELAARPGG